MTPKDTQEYVTLRAAAMMFLKAEEDLNKWYMLNWDDPKSVADYFNEVRVGHEAKETRLDAARSVLWDVINDKDLTK